MNLYSRAVELLVERKEAARAAERSIYDVAVGYIRFEKARRYWSQFPNACRPGLFVEPMTNVGTVTFMSTVRSA